MTTRAEWEARVRQELDGRDPASLATALPEGIIAPALPEPRPGEPAAIPWSPGAAGGGATTASATAGGPLNMTRIDGRDAGALRREIADDLTGGADALWIRASLADADPVAAALRDGAPPPHLVGVEATGQGTAAELVARLAGATNARLVTFVDAFQDRLPPSGDFAIATHAWRAAGAHGVLELSYAVAAAVHALRRLEHDGVDVAASASRLGFSVTVGRDLLAEIAKLRALRLLWAKILSAAGAPPTAPWIHAVSSTREMARRGPWNNILRGTTHALAAMCGGADAVTILPFDAVQAQATPAARRTARNTVAILRAECSLAAVADPAAGAPAIEQLSDAFARAAWRRFQEIEAGGGMAATLLRGEIRAELERARADLAEPVIGETEFPDPDGAPAAELAAREAAR